MSTITTSESARDREEGEASWTRRGEEHGAEDRKGKGKGPRIDVRNAKRVIYIDANKGSITT